MVMDRESVGIPTWEWRTVFELAAIAAPERHNPNGRVHMRSDGHRRRWSAGDAHRQVEIAGGPDAALIDLDIPMSLVRFAATVCAESAEVVLEVAGGDQPTSIAVSCPAGTMSMLDPTPPAPAPAPIDIRGHSVAAFSRASAGALLDLARVASSRCVAEHEADRGVVALDAPCWIGIGAGGLSVVVDGPEFGHSESRLQSHLASGTALAQINPVHLASLLAVFVPDDEVVVSLMRSGPYSVVIEGNDARAALIATPNQEELLRRRVEGVIRQACGTLAAQRDSNGDYLLRRRNVPILARITADDMALLQVYSVVIDGIEASPELYAEINDLNSSIAFARLFHRNGQVLAGADLMAESLEPDDLLVATVRIEHVARTIMPVLSTVFGGNVSADPVTERMIQYRSVVIEAEITPGTLTALNGSDACLDWPFPGTIHALTVHNPQGVEMDDTYYEAVTLRLVDDIVRSGGRFVHGRGSSPSRTTAEPYLVVWGLSREQARRMGQRANQDAIFELDQVAMRLVSCLDDRVESWVRFPTVVI